MSDVEQEESDREEDAITHIAYDGKGGWTARYAVDKGEYPIEFDSLDTDFMSDSLKKCERKYNRLVAVPKGSAQQGAVSQLSQISSSEARSVPGDLFSPDAHCQRNSILLAFREAVLVEKVALFTAETPSLAYLEETFADKLSRHLSINSVVRDDLIISTESQFKEIVMAIGTSWILSPISMNGYTGHSVVVKDGHWYDSAHECAKLGCGVDMQVDGWQNTVPYDWNHWHCVNLRQLILPSFHGYKCGCGVQITRTSQAAEHVRTKRHRGWMRSIK